MKDPTIKDLIPVIKNLGPHNSLENVKLLKAGRIVSCDGNWMLVNCDLEDGT